MPPDMCRFLARTGPRNHQRPLTNREIASRSGLGVGTISKLSQLKSWATVTVSTYEAYIKGCGVNPLCGRSQRQFVKRPDTKLAYQDRGSAAQKKMFRRIVESRITAPGV